MLVKSLFFFFFCSKVYVIPSDRCWNTWNRRWQRNINVCSGFYCNLSNSCWDISVWNKVAIGGTDYNATSTKPCAGWKHQSSQKSSSPWRWRRRQWMTMAAVSEFSGRNWKVLLLDVTLSSAGRVSQTTAGAYTHTHTRAHSNYCFCLKLEYPGHHKQHPVYSFRGRPAAWLGTSIRKSHARMTADNHFFSHQHHNFRVENCVFLWIL